MWYLDESKCFHSEKTVSSNTVVGGGETKTETIPGYSGPGQPLLFEYLFIYFNFYLRSEFGDSGLTLKFISANQVSSSVVG